MKNPHQAYRGDTGKIISLEVNYERLFKKMDGLAAHATDEVRRNVMRVILQNQRRVLRRYIPVDTGWLATKVGTKVSKPGAPIPLDGAFAQNQRFHPSSFCVWGSTFPLHDTFFVRRIPKAERFSVRTESNAERKKRLANYEIRGLNRKLDTGLVNIQTFRLENGVVRVIARNNRRRLAAVTEKDPNGKREPANVKLLQTLSRLRTGYRITSKTKGVSDKLVKASRSGAITLRKRLPWAESYWHEYGTKFKAARYPFARAAQVLDPQTKATFREMEARIYERYGRLGAW